MSDTRAKAKNIPGSHHDAAPATSRKLRHAAAICLAGVLLLSVVTASADIDVLSVKASLREDRLLARTQLEIGLSSQASEALERGIPLVFVIDMALHRRRAFIWDRRMGRWKFPFELRYHALSGRYVLEAPELNEFDTFLTVGEALRALGGPRSLSATLTQAPLATNEALRVSLRARLDIESLPGPLRVKAYLTPGWRLNSGWSRWNIEP